MTFTSPFSSPSNTACAVLPCPNIATLPHDPRFANYTLPADPNWAVFQCAATTHLPSATTFYRPALSGEVSGSSI